MAQYLLSVHGSADDVMPPEEEIAEIFAAVDAFNETLRASGAWVFAGGLQPVENATTVDGSGDRTVVTDGPFSESKEHLGGFWIIEVPDLDAALDWAARGSKACGGKVEVRPFQEEPA